MPKKVLVRAVVLAVVMVASIPCLAQSRPSSPEGDGATRDFGFFSRFRPKSTAKPRAKPVYRRKGAALDASKVVPDAAIGLTLWKARPATRRDPAADRDIVQKSDGTTTQLVLSRAGGDAELEIGQDFRIGIESPRTGFLYVINRSIRADGSAGAPYLIFPTARIHGGDNRVRGGQVVMLPTPPAEQPFTVSDSSGDLASEEVIVIVSNARLDVETRDERYELSKELVDGWMSRWTAPVETFEMEGGADAPYTAAEKAAATKPGRLLTASEPAPQLIQRVAAKPGDPLLVRMQIRVKRA